MKSNMRKDMNKKKILLLGNGGHCKSVIDSVISSGFYSEIGIVEKNDSLENEEGFSLFNDRDLPDLLKKGWTDAFITVGSVGDTSIREKLYSMIIDIGFCIPTIIDSSAIISDNTVIREGVFIGKNAVVNSGSYVEKCVIINTGAIVEHDCRIGEFAHISPGATICGEVFVGEKSHIGAGTVVRQQIKIGKGTMVGVGSVVVNDIPSDVIAYGNPCILRR